ncbi:MAG: MerR family transcriptional regulator [Desulfovibrionaceae bacterium]
MDDLGRYKTYKIGEAARHLDIKPYVLRYWETEFPQIAPLRSVSGQRLYTEEQMVLVRRIKALLYDEGLTIEGARRRLHEDGEPGLLREIYDELRAIQGLLGPADPEAGAQARTEGEGT